MNNYEDWAHLVAKKLKGEADVITAIEKDELNDAAATDAFIRAVLQPFLPENFGIGSGRIVDAFGNRSEHLDIVIYNRNFPRIGLRGTQSDYLYESVLATFSVRAKYIRKTFFESMDACASLARLETNLDKTVLIRLAKRNGLKPGPNKSFVHVDPLHTARFELIGRPPAFMFGFTGIKGSTRLLQENIELWIEHRQQQQIDTPMRAFPAVIATQGCFAWRNAAPLALSNREMMGIGSDDAPIRLIILHMLYLLNRRLNVTSDGYGLKPNLGSYLSQFKPPMFDVGVGPVDELVSLRMTHKGDLKEAEKRESEAARDHSAKAEPAKPVAEPVREAAAAAEASLPDTVGDEIDTDSAEQDSASSGVFDKPSPFASAPSVSVGEATADSPARPAPTLGSTSVASMQSPQQESAPAAQKPPAAPLGSAPIPSMQNSQQQPEPVAQKPPAAPLGSAPIPSAKPAAPAQLKEVIPQKPPVDIELTGETEVVEQPGADENSDFDSTVVISPDASLSRKQEGNNQGSGGSTEAFIARVKQQLSNSEPLAEQEEDSFSSTIPQ